MAKNDTEVSGETLIPEDADHAELRVYELGFHIDPELPQEEVKKTYQGLREKMAQAGSIVAEGEPQKVGLAYTISRTEVGGRRDFDSAYFAWVAYEADGAGHEAVIDAARADARLVRFLDLRTSKDAAKHAAEMHEIYAKMSTDQGPSEESSDVELDAALKEAGV